MKIIELVKTAENRDLSSIVTDTISDISGDNEHADPTGVEQANDTPLVDKQVLDAKKLISEINRVKDLRRVN